MVLDISGTRLWYDNLHPQSYSAPPTENTPSATLQAFEALPSVHLKKMGSLGAISTASFRGQPSRNTRLRIDDVPVQDTAGNVNLSPLWGGTTQLKSVIPGSHGVRYGEGSSGGLLLMETPFLPSANSATVEVGSFQTGYGHLAHQHTTPSTKWVIHGQGLRNQGLPQYGSSRKLGEKGRMYNTQLATRLQHQLDHDSILHLSGRTSEHASKYDLDPQHLSPKPQGNQTNHISLIGVGLEKTLPTHHHFFRTFASHHKLKYTETPVSQILMTGATYEGTYTLSPRLVSTLLGGVESHHVQSTPLLKKTAILSHLGGLQKILITPHLAAEVGARLDQHQKLGSQGTYTASLAHTSTTHLIKAGIHRGFLNPSDYEMYITNPFIQGNPALKPQQTQTIDATLQKQFPIKNLVFQVTPFWTQTKKTIHAIFENNRYRTVNLPGKTYISGFESQLTYTPQDDWKLFLSYGYTNLNCSKANVNPEFPKHKAQGRLEHELFPDVKITPELHYIGRRRSYSGEPLKDYFLTHISIKQELKPGFSVFGRVHNCFDTRYEQTYGYQTPRREFYVGMHVHF
ncbi:MAG: TonB-dependent receptor plug domain-containing protein [Alphaproteobacteria bacterium]